MPVRLEGAGAGAAAGGRDAISLPGADVPGPGRAPPTGGSGWLSIGGSGAVSTGTDGMASTGAGAMEGAAAALRMGAPDNRAEEQAPRASAEHEMTARA